MKAFKWDRKNLKFNDASCLSSCDTLKVPACKLVISANIMAKCCSPSLWSDDIFLWMKILQHDIQQCFNQLSLSTLIIYIQNCTSWCWLIILPVFIFLCVAALPLVELFGGKEEGIKQLITLMYCFRGDLPNLANIVGKLVSLNMAYSVRKPLWGKSKLWPGERIIKEHGLNDRTWTRRDTTFNYTRGGWA